MEIVNRYGGTVFGQALWSAFHEYERTHGEIFEALISAGVKVEVGTHHWWDKQDVPLMVRCSLSATVTVKYDYGA